MRILLKIQKIIAICIVYLVSLFFTSINIYAAPPTDWAFQENSRPLNDAIINKYPTIDDNGDGYISIYEANIFTSSKSISLASSNISGTIDGIEYFLNIEEINLASNQLSGEIPSNVGNLSNLRLLYLDNNQLSGSIPDSVTEKMLQHLLIFVLTQIC